VNKFILATKQKMTQLFDEDGRVHAVTVLLAGPVTVTAVKTAEKDGYIAVQVGYGSRKEKNVSKAVKGHLKGKGPFSTIREFRAGRADVVEQKDGETIDVSAFSVGDTVVVSALSKAKGFQGVVKRHGFHGGPRTHGQKHNERSPGSIGSGLRTRTPIGMKMGGRMGGDRVTVKNLKVLHIDTEAGLMYVSGAVPGRRGTVVEVREVVKIRHNRNYGS
jgi:large subunit ribosomal protein L3